MPSSFVKVLALLSVAAAVTATGAAQNAPAAIPGNQAFARYCAGCHGGDGRGSDKAPSIATLPEVVGMSDAQLVGVVTNGTQSGMPPFGFLGAQNVSAVIGYLRTLQGVQPGANAAASGDQRGNGRGRGASNGGGSSARAANTPVTGNAANGKALFFGKAQCSNCHAVAGEGGVLGPEMSNYGASHPPAAIEESILHPGAAAAVPARRGGGFGGGAAASRPVEIKTKSGKTLTGMVRGEDNLHLAVQTETRYYFLDRSSLASVTYLKTSLMPTDYGTRLTPAELNDIVSYIVVTGRAAPVEPQPAAPVGRRRGGGF